MNKEATLLGKVVVSTNCDCGEDYCACYAFATEDYDQLIKDWCLFSDKTNSDSVRIDGENLTWQSLSGYTIADYPSQILSLLELRGDYTITFELWEDEQGNYELNAWRTSHDEMGASFKFTFIDEE